MIARRRTREVRCGTLAIGGANPIWVQSMTASKTADLESARSEIRRMLDAGCEIVRVAVFDSADAAALEAVKRFLGRTPLVADIHFNPALALEAIARGADKIRLNPGNVAGRPGRFESEGKERVRAVAEAARRKGVSLRVGVNSGSVEKDLLEKHGRPSAEALVESALRHCAWLEDCGFRDVVVSLKSTDLEVNHEANLRFAGLTDYPIHVGVTEAGLPEYGAIKSALGIGRLLLEGIGDTIRVSLAAEREREIRAAFDILRAAGRRLRGPEIVACPSCGRVAIDVGKVARDLRERLRDVRAPMKIAILGCAVNGPGEASEADLGLAGGRGRGLLFRRGIPLRDVPEEEMAAELEREARKLAAEIEGGTAETPGPGGGGP